MKQNLFIILISITQENYQKIVVNDECIHLHLNTRLSFTSLLLITFANSVDPDQAWQNVGPDLDPNCLMLW